MEPSRRGVLPGARRFVGAGFTRGARRFSALDFPFRGSVGSGLNRWSRIHAFLIVPVVVISGAAGSPGVLSFFAVFSFLVLIFGATRRWSQSGGFGPANMVTAFRLGGVVSLPLLSSTLGPGSLAIIGPGLFGLDGLDGWLARRGNETSEFGEYFDKETDALFLLFLCLLAFLNQRAGSWILIPGLLRYLFVIIIHLLRPDFQNETKSDRARILYSIAMTGVLATFTPFPGFYKPLAVIGTTGLILSFLWDFYSAVSTR